MPRSGLVGTLSRVRSRPLRNLVAGLDLTRSTGLRYARQRWGEERSWRGMLAASRNEAYVAIWGHAAEELGVGFSALGEGRFEISRRGRTALLTRGHAGVDSPSVLATAFDKPRHHELLRAAGIPVPDQVEFSAAHIEPALGLLARAGGAIVVKPAAGTGAGSGVTSGVSSFIELERAVLRASRSASRLQAERQASGAEYRVLVLDDEILDVVCRRRPRAVGDGRSSIAELVAAENRRRLSGDGLERLRMLKVDLDCVFTLERQGLSLRSVPAAGESVILKQVVNQNAAAENETLREPLAPALHEEALEAARRVGIRLAGIDIVTPDLSCSLAEAGGVVLEVNADPGIHHHYAVADRQGATPVAVPILRAVLRERFASKEATAR